jgi:hypothetical protein
MTRALRRKWLVDVCLFAGFVVAFFLDLTGLQLHQWLGVAASALAAYHLVTHWTWVRTVTGRFLGRASGRARLYYLLDVSILAGFAITGLTGLAISSWLNLSLAGYDRWLVVHIQVSIGTLILTLVKIGLHRRWLVATWRKMFSRPKQQVQPESPVLKPVPAAVPVAANRQTSRRDFVKMMSIVGFTSLLALGSAARSLGDASTEQDTEEVASNPSSWLSSSLNSTTSDSSCSVQCSRGCTYPGHCRRYTDSNGNNRCDFGECA